jgi:5-methyltetrahydropteroyltriglutamate--homocysteine methyltransferase
MKTSQDRILTTHVGSLPRPAELRRLLVAKDKGEPYDKAEFERLTRQAVFDIVRRQAETGVDIINDGEMSKPGYSTYVADRLSGFAGHEPAKPRLDTRDHPNFMAAYERMTGSNIARRSVCVGPIAVQDREPLAQDLANLRDALAQVSAVEGFMTAASPGLVPVFQNNRYYPSHEDYVEAIAAAMQQEYEAIVEAGFVLQLDCPDLAMAHHTSFQDLGEADFLRRAAFHIEVLNHALRNVPADRARIHICWGNYEGPHDHDIDFAKVAPILVKAKPMALVIEAANPRHAHEWRVWHEVKLPDDKILIPGVLDTSTNYVEHPELVAERLCRFADIVGRERVMAGSDCGFGTFAGYGKLDPDISFKKLRAMVEGAAIASKRLWGKATA